MFRKSQDAAPSDSSPTHPTAPEFAGRSGNPVEFGAFRPVIFGEALFDHFPDGSRVLGGAPFNVAWHLRGFGADPLLVTSVGQDPEGREILERMGSWQMDTSGVQLHPTKPTGKVTAHLENGQPTFEIEAKKAFDGIAIEGLPVPSVHPPPSLLYFGSLCLREETSAATLAYLRETLDPGTLVDVNLRDPWWQWERTRGHIRGVEWLKINNDEVGLLTKCPVTNGEEVLEAAGILKADLNIRNVVVTLGAQGAVSLSGDEIVRVEGHRIPTIVDTVGAGDAFTSVLALGIHANWPTDTILRRATAFAAKTCLTRGATVADPTLYLRALREWNHAP